MRLVGAKGWLKDVERGARGRPQDELAHLALDSTGGSDAGETA